MQIKSIVFNAEYPTVHYSHGGETVTDSVFPGRGAEPVLPSTSFARAIGSLLDLLTSEHSLSPDHEWRLAKIEFRYDDETQDLRCYKATLKGYADEVGRQQVVIDPTSIQNVSEAIFAKLETVLKQSVQFVGGESAQGNILTFKQSEAS